MGAQLMYKPMVEMETTAEKATVLCSMGKPRMKENMVMALLSIRQSKHAVSLTVITTHYTPLQMLSHMHSCIRCIWQRISIHQTALMGVPVSGFTLDHTLWYGTPPSRLNAHNILHACGQQLVSCIVQAVFPRGFYAFGKPG